MKCLNCNTENNSNHEICKKCGLKISEQLWTPSLKWYLKTMAMIYVFLAFLYVGLDLFLNKINWK